MLKINKLIYSFQADLQKAKHDSITSTKHAEILNEKVRSVGLIKCLLYSLRIFECISIWLTYFVIIILFCIKNISYFSQNNSNDYVNFWKNFCQSSLDSKIFLYCLISHNVDELWIIIFKISRIRRYFLH